MKDEIEKAIDKYHYEIGFDDSLTPQAREEFRTAVAAVVREELAGDWRRSVNQNITVSSIVNQSPAEVPVLTVPPPKSDTCVCGHDKAYHYDSDSYKIDCVCCKKQGKPPCGAFTPKPSKSRFPKWRVWKDDGSGNGACGYIKAIFSDSKGYVYLNNGKWDISSNETPDNCVEILAPDKDALLAKWPEVFGKPDADIVCQRCGCKACVCTMGKLIEKARNHVMTPEEKEAQRQNFAHGNLAATTNHQPPKPLAVKDLKPGSRFKYTNPGGEVLEHIIDSCRNILIEGLDGKCMHNQDNEFWKIWAENITDIRPAEDVQSPKVPTGSEGQQAGVPAATDSRSLAEKMAETDYNLTYPTSEKWDKAIPYVKEDRIKRMQAAIADHVEPMMRAKDEEIIRQWEYGNEGRRTLKELESERNQRKFLEKVRDEKMAEIANLYKAIKAIRAALP